jgi:hypothetical protein
MDETDDRQRKVKQLHAWRWVVRTAFRVVAYAGPVKGLKESEREERFCEAIRSLDVGLQGFAQVYGIDAELALQQIDDIERRLLEQINAMKQPASNK